MATRTAPGGARAGEGPQPDWPRPNAPGGLPRVPAAAGAVAERAFVALSALRRARVFHPDGVAFEATFQPLPGAAAEGPGAPLLATAEPRAALVRASRGVGLPRALPDVLGLAIRVPDAGGPGADQDLLLVTSGGPPLARHLPLPSPSFFSLPYSSLLAVRAGGRVRIAGALPEPPAGGDRDGIDGLVRAAGLGQASFRIGLAPLLGSLCPVARLTLGARLPERAERALRFDPWSAGGGIVPVGPLMGVRLPAYRGSRRGWPEG